MKKEELSQDQSALSRYTKEVCYVKNKQGQYETALSTGWDVKIDALNSAWDEVERRIEKARVDVVEGRKSPIFYFMEKQLMEPAILAAYTDFWSITIKRHFKPSVFKKLSRTRLEKYAEIFEVSVDELINYKG